MGRGRGRRRGAGRRRSARLGQLLSAAGDPAAGAFIGIAAFAVAAGLAEEPGWRGVAQDAVAPRLGVLGAGCALGAAWSTWHLPLHLIDGTYQAGLGLGTGAFWASVLARIPLAVLLVWVVAGTAGRLGPAVLTHALGNLTGELLDETTRGLWVQVAALTAGAAAVALVQHRSPRAVLRPSVGPADHGGAG